jgi:hypothetical protein
MAVNLLILIFENFDCNVKSRWFYINVQEVRKGFYQPCITNILYSYCISHEHVIDFRNADDKEQLLSVGRRISK